MTREEAEERLRAPGVELVPDFQEEPSDEVDAGVVIDLGEDVPAELPKGSSVPLIVSIGSDDPEVPDLEGENYEDAITELEALGLEVELDFREPRDNRGDGEVIRTEPDEGDDVEPGSTVVVVIAGGKAIVPPVEGLELDAAEALLQARGLEVGQVFGSPDSTVQETVPLVDSPVEPGSAVDLVMASDG
jgi:eukaryotic-like serine/threonine-protein kinase